MRFLVFLAALALSGAAHAQVGLIVGQTPVVGGSTGQCLSISTGKLQSVACSSGASGPAGGVLAGTYPNPSFAVTPIFSGGAAGGVLSGTYPNPGFAADPAFSGTLTATKGAFGGASIGSNDLAVNGQSLFNNNVTVSGAALVMSSGDHSQVLNYDYGGQHKFTNLGRIDWADNGNIGSTRDLGLEHSAAGTLLVNNGTLGTITGTSVVAGGFVSSPVNALSPLWKLGAVTTEACVADGTKTVRVNIGGADVKLAVCQ